jgi:hypothetical protein
MFAQIIQRWKSLNTIAKLAVGLVLGGILFAIWVFSPALYDRQVAEPFPTSQPVATTVAAIAEKPTEPAPTATLVPEPTAAVQSAATLVLEPTVAAAIEPTATAQPEPTTAPQPATATPEPTITPLPPTATPAPTGPIVVATGSFVSGSVPGDEAEGTATIYTLEDGQRILRLEQFRTTNGPDLVVAFHTGANPEKDAGEYFVLDGLKGNQGDQNYALPADFDLSKYRSVVIWCRTFNIAFGFAELKS